MGKAKKAGSLQNSSVVDMMFFPTASTFSTCFTTLTTKLQSPGSSSDLHSISNTQILSLYQDQPPFIMNQYICVYFCLGPMHFNQHLCAILQRNEF